MCTKDSSIVYQCSDVVVGPYDKDIGSAKPRVSKASKRHAIRTLRMWTPCTSSRVMTTNNKQLTI